MNVQRTAEDVLEILAQRDEAAPADLEHSLQVLYRLSEIDRVVGEQRAAVRSPARR